MRTLRLAGIAVLAWVAVLVVAVAAARPARADEGVGADAARLAASPRGYRVIVRDLLAWHGTRTNGCVAFVVTALRHAGFVVPDHRPAGPWSNPARVTFSLDAHLAAAGWSRVDDDGALLAGDLVFTQGAPDHVMLFHGWADRRRRVALVSDNQRRRYRRPLRPTYLDEVSGFAFARRAPAAAVDAPAAGSVRSPP